MRFYVFLIRVIYLTIDKMVPGLAGIMNLSIFSHNLSIFSHNLWKCGQSKQSDDNFIGNKSFTS